MCKNCFPMPNKSHCFLVKSHGSQLGSFYSSSSYSWDQPKYHRLILHNKRYFVGSSSLHCTWIYRIQLKILTSTLCSISSGKFPIFIWIELCKLLLVIFTVLRVIFTSTIHNNHDTIPIVQQFQHQKSLPEAKSSFATSINCICTFSVSKSPPCILCPILSPSLPTKVLRRVAFPDTARMCVQRCGQVCVCGARFCCHAQSEIGQFYGVKTNS